MAEYELQVGDRVECVDDGGGSYDFVKRGAEYTVTHCRGDLIGVGESTEAEHSASRFRLIRKRGESEGSPQVGETWIVSDGAGNESTIRVEKVDDSGFVYFADGGAYPVGANVAAGFRRLLRRSPAPPPTPPVEKVAERGDPPSSKLDPDGYLNREAMDERRRGERLDFGARRLASVQAHKLDLDRKISTVRGRLAVEVKAALRTWPSHEGDD